MARLRARIVGGSLAGLFAATLLKQAGHDVRIYERSVRGLDGRGAGLLAKKETFAILRAAGCEHVARVSVIARERLTFDETGAVVDRSMAPQSQLSWDYLYRTFRDFIAGDDYMLGRHVDGIRQDDDAAYLTFKDGGEESADVIIGADGAASIVRNAVNGRLSPSKYAGYVGWRGLLPETALPPEAAADLLDRFAFHQISGSHILGFLVAGPHAETTVGSRRYNWVWYRPAAGEIARAEVFTDSAGRVHPYSLPPGSVPQAARAVMIGDAARLLPPSSQHRVRCALDVLRLAVEPAAFARRRINVKAELGGDHDLVADGRQRFPDQGFVGPGTVDLGSIEQGDAEVVGAADDAYALGLFRRLAVGRSETQDPKAEFGHLQGAQLSHAHLATPIEPDGPSAVSGAGCR
jgi:2-polyprenyl-6-methoxyphenol hydroxylase-like FAD-dependent oxidoreductase